MPRSRNLFTLRTGLGRPAKAAGALVAILLVVTGCTANDPNAATSGGG